MRIGIITSAWGAPWSEGVRNLARTLRGHLLECGDEVVVIHPKIADGETETPRSMSSAWYARAGMSFLWNARNRLRSENIDTALWFTSLSSWYGIKQRILKTSGVPVVPYVTGLRPYLTGYRSLSVQSPSLVITPFLQKHYLPNATYIPPFIPINLKLSSEFNRCLDGKKFKVLFLGSFEKERGVECLLKAMARLDERYQLTLAWNGVGAHREGVIHGLIDSLNIKSRVRLLRDIDVSKEYERADVMIIPRRSQTRMAFPVRILEAARMRLPMIVSDIVGMGNLIGEAGSSVPPDNPQKLADAISTLLEGQNNYEAAVAGTLRLEEKCSPLDSLERTRKVLQYAAA